MPDRVSAFVARCPKCQLVQAVDWNPYRPEHYRAIAQWAMRGLVVTYEPEPFGGRCTCWIDAALAECAEVENA